MSRDLTPNREISSMNFLPPSFLRKQLEDVLQRTENHGSQWGSSTTLASLLCTNSFFLQARLWALWDQGWYPSHLYPQQIKQSLQYGRCSIISSWLSRRLNKKSGPFSVFGIPSFSQHWLGYIKMQIFPTDTVRFSLKPLCVQNALSWYKIHIIKL